jgi:dTDP-4-amino-4,6-dideoxygalactose transaminase
MKEVGRRGDFILGRALDAFEAAFAAYVGVRHCVGVASGTDALHLALRALGIGRGDEVILPANTFIATAQAVWACGADPVLVDCDEHTATIDPAAVREAITPRTKAIMPVHLFGQAANMDSLLALANDHQIAIVEDAAQAHGAAYCNRRCGSMGVAAGFSFYPGKNLGAWGDGGAITTDDDRLAAEIRVLRNIGAPSKYVHTRMGFNSRLDTVQAAVLTVKLADLDRANDRRSEVAARYRAAFERLAPRVQVVSRAPWTTRHAYHLFVVRVPADERDRVAKTLQVRGIGAGIHYPIPIHRQAGFQPLLKERRAFPVTERLAAEMLSLPICADITDAEVTTVIGEFSRAVDG